MWWKPSNICTRGMFTSSTEAFKCPPLCSSIQINLSPSQWATFPLQRNAERMTDVLADKRKIHPSCISASILLFAGQFFLMAVAVCVREHTQLCCLKHRWQTSRFCVIASDLTSSCCFSLFGRTGRTFPREKSQISFCCFCLRFFFLCCSFVLFVWAAQTKPHLNASQIDDKSRISGWIFPFGLVLWRSG